MVIWLIGLNQKWKILDIDCYFFAQNCSAMVESSVMTKMQTTVSISNTYNIKQPIGWDKYICGINIKTNKRTIHYMNIFLHIRFVISTVFFLVNIFEENTNIIVSYGRFSSYFEWIFISLTSSSWVSAPYALATTSVGAHTKTT